MLQDKETWAKQDAFVHIVHSVEHLDMRQGYDADPLKITEIVLVVGQLATNDSWSRLSTLDVTIMQIRWARET